MISEQELLDIICTEAIEYAGLLGAGRGSGNVTREYLLGSTVLSQRAAQGAGSAETALARRRIEGRLLHRRPRLDTRIEYHARAFGRAAPPDRKLSVRILA